MSLLRCSLAVVLGLALAACGGDDDGGDGADGDDTPDAGGGGGDPDGGGGGALCAELESPAGTIDSYPGSFDGATVGGGADLSNPRGVCGEDAGDWYEEVGEDVVVALTGLEPGAVYAATVVTDEDLGLYVVTGCQPANAGPAEGECLAYADLTLEGEQVGFVAPESGTAWVVVDSANIPEPATGAFRVEVVLVECVSPFECTDGEPICGEDFSCTAGYAQCTGDDANDDGTGGDDGPAAATVLDTPAEGVPTVVDAAVCSLPAGEQDWYTVVITEAGLYGATLVPGNPVDMDLYVLDDEGNVVGAGVEEGPVAEQLLLDLTPGSYYLVTYLFDPPDQAAAEPYTMTLAVAECETSFDCADAAEPVCGGGGLCEPGPAQCTSDDAADAGGGDDGPAAARSLNGAVDVDISRKGKICNVPDTETDWYSFTVTDGQGMDLDLSWTGNQNDLDVDVVGPTGELYGISLWVNPELVSLTYLPAGTYYVRVTLFAPADDAGAKRYTITATKRAALSCVDAADCAGEHATQLYRGDCTGGVCAFLNDTNTGAGDPCDFSTLCAGDGFCSYIPFESDAENSVCTDTCTDDTDCDLIGAGLTCTTGFNTNFCLPTCDGPLECGANTNSPALEPGQPWDYLTCDVPTGACSL